MKTLFPFLAIILLSSCTVKTPEPEAQSASPDFYIGSWALDLGYDNNKVGWLEVRQEEGYLDADLLWRWGSVGPAEFVFVAEDILYITQGRDLIRKKDENGNPVKKQHSINFMNINKINDDQLAGIAFFPNDNGVGFEKISFTGKRIPETNEIPDFGSIKYEEAINLLNGTDLTGWELLGGFGANGWKMEDGVLLNDPVQKEGEEHINYGNLKTSAVFEDFNLKLEVNVPEGSNSGVYLRGIYEIQIFDSYGKALDSHNMGALYSRMTPSVSAEKPAGEWQELDITLYKRFLTVKLNGTTIIDKQPVKGVTGGAMSSDEFSPGPIYLQGDHGKVAFRNIILTPII